MVFRERRALREWMSARASVAERGWEEEGLAEDGEEVGGGRGVVDGWGEAMAGGFVCRSFCGDGKAAVAVEILKRFEVRNWFCSPKLLYREFRGEKYPPMYAYRGTYDVIAPGPALRLRQRAIILSKS